MHTPCKIKQHTSSPYKNKNIVFEDLPASIMDLLVANWCSVSGTDKRIFSTGKSQLMEANLQVQ
jgi:hypothetical protein